MAIVRVALPVAAHQPFDYWLPEGLSAMPGSIVVVTLGRRRLRGVVLEVVTASDMPPERVIPIEQLSSDLPPLADDLRELARFTAAYYQEPIGECYALMLPPAMEGARRAALPRPTRYRLSDEGRKLLRGRPRAAGHRRAEMLALLASAEGAGEAQIREWGSHALRTVREWQRKGLVEALQASAAGIVLRGALALNDEQHSAIHAALPQPSDFLVSLLQGVTGSGKSEVYLASAARVIAAGRQALLLVPEINLTPQLEERVAAALPGVRVALLHSRLAAAARRSNWLAAARGEAQLVLGTRLAVFAPASATGPHRRRRRARRIVQAAGRRSLQRARSRRLSRAAAQRSRDSGKRDAVARKLRAGAARAIRVAQAHAAGDGARGAARGAIGAEPGR